MNRFTNRSSPVRVDELAVLPWFSMPVPTQHQKHCRRLRVDAVVPRPDRREVDVAAVLGVLRREDVVEERALVVVGVSAARVGAEQQLGQPEHVVGVAGLRPFARDSIIGVKSSAG